MPEPPVVEMLWESHDPEAALRERFGLDGGPAAARWVAATLGEHWGLTIDACDRIVISDRNALAWVRGPSGRLLAKWSVAPRRFPRLAEVARLTHWLGGRGLPVSAPVPTRDGALQVETHGVSMGLQRQIDGDLLDASDPRQVRAAGAVLARLHEALAAYATDRIGTAGAKPPPLTGRITDWLDADAAHLPEAARTALRRLVADAPDDALPIQLVHGDVRSANVLCVGADVAAVLDLEEVRLDHRVVELARSAVLLGTRFRDWGPVSASVRAELRAGYESARRLTPLEAAWWDTVVLWQSLAMVPPGEDPHGWGAAALDQLRAMALER